MKTLRSVTSIVALAVALLSATAMGQELPPNPIPTGDPPAPFEFPDNYRFTDPNFEPDNYVAFLAEGQYEEYMAPNGSIYLRYHATPPPDTTDFTRVTSVFPWPESLSGTMAQWYVLYDQTRFHEVYGLGECHTNWQIHLWVPPDEKITLLELPSGTEQAYRELTFLWPDYPDGELAALEVRTKRFTGEDCGQIEAMDRHFLEALGLIPVANEEGPETDFPTELTLGTAYPNPFNPSTTVPFVLSEAGSVELAVYDALGRKVATLVDEVRAAGWHKVQFDAEGLPSGVYLVRLEAGDAIRTSRIVLAK